MSQQDEPSGVFAWPSKRRPTRRGKFATVRSSRFSSKSANAIGYVIRRTLTQGERRNIVLV